MSTVSTTFSANTGNLFASLNQIESRMAGVASKMQAVGASFAQLAAPLLGITATLGGVAGAAFGVKHAITEAANMEQLETAFATLTGSADVARETLQKLVTFADQTTFEMPELAAAAKQLIAFKVPAAEVIDYLKMLGDISAGLNVPLGELADVFGRNLVQGRLFSKDIYQFQSRGIPIMSELAKQFGVTEGAVMGMVEAGRVGTKEMLTAFRALTGEGGQFSGMLAKQAKTFGGLMSTLRDNFNALFREFGAPLMESLKPVVESLIERMKGLVPVAKEIGERFAGALNGLVMAVQTGQLGEVVSVSLELAFAKSLNFFVGAFQSAMAGIGAVMTNVLGNADFYAGLTKAFIGVAGQFGAALLQAVSSPLTYLQAGMEYLTEKVIAAFTSLIPIASGSLAHRVLGVTGTFKARSFDEIHAGRQREGLSVFGMGTNDIAGTAQGLTREGVAQMGGPLRSLFSDLQLVVREFAPGSLIDTSALQERLARLLDSFAPVAAAGASAARTGAAGIAGGAFGSIEPIADSLAKIGGGGNYRAFSPELSEAQKQTGQLEKANATLDQIKDGIVRGSYEGKRAMTVDMTS